MGLKGFDFNLKEFCVVFLCGLTGARVYIRSCVMVWGHVSVRDPTVSGPQ